MSKESYAPLVVEGVEVVGVAELGVGVTAGVRAGVKGVKSWCYEG